MRVLLFFFTVYRKSTIIPLSIRLCLRMLILDSLGLIRSLCFYHNYNLF
ncbi:hypothetical protein RICGR_1473 [Rickettsiella grylli]|uniref:Uncharacterized protein n=1 Tax=Rickettsiella grylli TaxID=59196 RepID=A8PQB6_9COXI|nr:hypothetical protein RICGR_1473 [Rickettsiella grylli]